MDMAARRLTHFTIHHWRYGGRVTLTGRHKSRGEGGISIWNAGRSGAEDAGADCLSFEFRLGQEQRTSAVHFASRHPNTVAQLRSRKRIREESKAGCTGKQAKSSGTLV